MVATGMGGQEDMMVVIGGDASGLLSAVAASKAGLATLRNAVGLAGGALATLAGVGIAKAISAAQTFQNSMIEVEKVTSGETAARLRKEIFRLGETIPLAHDQLASLAEQAARFGVPTDQISGFVESVAKFGSVTELSVEEAGEAFAKLTTLTGTPITQIDNLGSAINSLGNTAATSGPEIVNALLRSAAAGTQLGLSTEELAGLAATMNEVSPNAQQAGTALNRLFVTLQDPGKVEAFAEALGVTPEAFKRIRKEDPFGTVMSLIDVMREGGDTAEALGASLDERARRALLGLAQAHEDLIDNLETANTEYAEATSLQEEYEKQQKGTTSQTQLLRNAIHEQAVSIGEVYRPALTDVIRGLREWLQNENSLINRLTAKQKALALSASGVIGLAAAVGTLNPALGAVTLAVGSFAVAWQADLGNIRQTTSAFVDDVSGSFQRLMDAIPGGEWLQENAGEWQEWAIFIGGVLDVLATTTAELIDKVVLAIELAASGARTLGELAAAAKEGRFGDFGDILDRAGERESAIWDEAQQRGRFRWQDLRGRIAQANQQLQNVRAGLTPEGTLPDHAAQRSDDAPNVPDSPTDWLRDTEEAANAQADAAEKQAEAAETVKTGGTALVEGAKTLDETRARLLDPLERVDCFELETQETLVKPERPEFTVEQQERFRQEREQRQRQFIQEQEEKFPPGSTGVPSSATTATGDLKMDVDGKSFAGISFREVRRWHKNNRITF